MLLLLLLLRMLLSHLRNFKSRSAYGAFTLLLINFDLGQSMSYSHFWMMLCEKLNISQV